MAIKSYVKIKPIKDDGAYSGSFNQIRKGINRTGSVMTSIANNNIETHKLVRFEKDYLRKTYKVESTEVKKEDKEKVSIFQKWSKGFKDMFKLQKRDKKEEEAEKKEEPEKEKKEGLGKPLQKVAKSFFGQLSGFLTPIFTFFVKMGIFKWLTDPDNIKKAQKVFQLFVSIGKFVFWLAGGVVSMIGGGLTKLFGNDETGIKKGFSQVFGFFQLLAGLAGLRYLLNPLKLFTDGKKLFGLFNKTNDAEVTWKKQEQWRKFGYKDKETGKIYTEKEYKAQKKSVERQQKKLKAQGKHDQANRVGSKFNNRVNNPTKLQRGKNVGGKLLKPGAQKGIAAVGGITRIASGIASGEDATQAVGAGVGQAAGGMIGAAAGTALLGPFLGPFAPIVGNAIGSFLGEWVGKTFLPLIKPIFEPIQKMFGMWLGLIKQVAEETGITEFLGTFFKFVGEIGKVLFNIIGWIMKPIQWLLGGALKVLGGVINFIIGAAKNIFAFMTAPFKFARRVLMRQDPGKDVKLEEFGDGGEMVIAKGKPARKLQSFAGGGPTRISLTNEDIEPPQFVYSHQRFTSKITEHVKNGELVELKKEKEFYEVMGSIYYHILLKEHDDILGKLISLKLLKPHHTIRDVIEGSAANHIKPEILYPIFKQSKAQKLSDDESRERTKAFYKRHNLEIGQSWVADNFAKGGEVKTKPIKSVYNVPQLAMGGNVPDLGDIQAMTETRDMQLKEFQYKNQRDTDIEDIVLPPRVIAIKTTVPVINTVTTGSNVKPIRSSPSPLFTC